MLRFAFGTAVALISLISAIAQGVPLFAPGVAGPAVRPHAAMTVAEAKTKGWSEIEPGHRDKLRGIVDAFDAGTTGGVADAAAQIDAVLSNGERKSLLADRAAMRAALKSGPATHPADPGRFLVMISATPGAIEAARDGSTPARPSTFGL